MISVRRVGTGHCVLFLLALTGCGGSTPLTTDGGLDADDHDADAAEDAAIHDDCPPNVADLEDAPCSPEGTVCGGPCTDPCSFCNLMGCFDGRWQRLEAHPMPCFPCGDQQCVQPEQYCRIQRSDIGGIPDDFDCLALPDDCEAPSCECLAETIVFSACTDHGGEVTVELFGG